MFGMPALELYFNLMRGAQFFHQHTVRFYQSRPNLALTLRLLYFVVRMTWEAAEEDDDNVFLTEGRKECILMTDFDTFLDTELFDGKNVFENMKFLLCPRKEFETTKPLHVTGNFKEVVRVVGFIDKNVLFLDKFNINYRDEGKLRIPHTPHVRRGFMNHVKKSWKNELIHKKWMALVKDLSITPEMAFRGASKEFLESIDSDSDLEVLQSATPRYQTRSVSRSGKSTSKKGESKSTKSKRRYRRSVWSEEDDDEDVVMSEIGRSRKGKRRREETRNDRRKRNRQA